MANSTKKPVIVNFDRSMDSVGTHLWEKARRLVPNLPIPTAAKPVVEYVFWDEKGKVVTDIDVIKEYMANNFEKFERDFKTQTKDSSYTIGIDITSSNQKQIYSLGSSNFGEIKDRSLSIATAQHDENGNVTREDVFKDGVKTGYTTYEHDENGNLVSSTTYDNEDRPVKVVTYDENEKPKETVTYGYDKNGKPYVEEHRDRNGELTESHYREYENGKLKKETVNHFDKDGTKIDTVEYDNQERPISSYTRNRDGELLEYSKYEYNSDNSYVRKDYNSSDKITAEYSYDTSGNIKEYATYSYNSSDNGFIKTVFNGDESNYTEKTVYKYNSAGELISTEIYDRNNKLISSVAGPGVAGDGSGNGAGGGGASGDYTEFSISMVEARRMPEDDAAKARLLYALFIKKEDGVVFTNFNTQTEPLAKSVNEKIKDVSNRLANSNSGRFNDTNQSAILSTAAQDSETYYNDVVKPPKPAEFVDKIDEYNKNLDVMKEEARTDLANKAAALVNVNGRGQEYYCSEPVETGYGPPMSSHKDPDDEANSTRIFHDYVFIDSHTEEIEDENGKVTTKTLYNYYHYTRKYHWIFSAPGSNYDPVEKEMQRADCADFIEQKYTISKCHMHYGDGG